MNHVARFSRCLKIQDGVQQHIQTLQQELKANLLQLAIARNALSEIKEL